jgi:hypothetical protein
VPAAAVIPAPIAYIKVVAVKKLVVGFLPGRGRSACLGEYWFRHLHLLGERVCTSLCVLGASHFTLKKLECSSRLYTLNI